MGNRFPFGKGLIQALLGLGIFVKRMQENLAALTTNNLRNHV